MKNAIELLVKLGLTQEYATKFCESIWIDACDYNDISVTSAIEQFRDFLNKSE
jgi:hypothetical protein